MASDKKDGEIEDGEIETDEEEYNVNVIANTANEKSLPASKSSNPTIDNRASSNTNNNKTNKEPVEDDWAINVEKAIANALKKDGVEPPLPNIAIRTQDTEQNQQIPKSKRRKKTKSEKKRNKREEEEKNAKKDPSSQGNSAQPSVVVDLMDVDVDEYEMLGMRGGSPVRQNEGNQPQTVLSSGDDSSSYESDDFDNKGSARASDRRKRRRDRSRNRNDRNNKRQRNDRRDRERDREGRDRDRDDEDEVRREPRKMEICKFYLLDCCAKRNNCSYLHSEFPCKYYYLGMECPLKDCKLNHGKPLTAEFRGILLKHLETAPKEILGDFPRMSRDKALKMMDAAHINLLREARGEAPLENKIPSLLDGLDGGGKGRKGNNDNNNKKRSRWCDNVPPAPELPEDKPKELEKKEVPEHLSVRKLSDILSAKQIDDLIAMKIEHIDQIKELTLLQMTNLGLTIAQISEIQVKALNIVKEMEQMDLDLRQKQPNDVDLREKDVDLRILPPTTSNSTTSSLASVPITSALQALQEKTAKKDDQPPSYANFATPTLDLSQYLLDSQIKDDEKEEASNKNESETVDDEQELQIDESWDDPGDSENESESNTSKKETKKPSDIMSPIHTQESLIATLKEMEKARAQAMQPPSYSAANTSELIHGFSSFYEQKSKEVEEKPLRRPSINEIKSPSVDGGSGDESPHRPSIYDLQDNEDSTSDLEGRVDAKMNTKGDRDMRIMLMNTTDETSGGGDMDLRLPFKPIMAHYIPATEIDASITSHLPIEYKLYICDVPKPDYSELRRSKNYASIESISDPRLRRLMGVKSNKQKTKEQELPPPIASPDLIPSSPKQNVFNSPSSTANRASPTVQTSSPRQDPRVDPRRRREEISNQQNSSRSNKDPNQLDTQQLLVLLQKSPWYQELSSNNKILVNQHLATLSGDLKRFHLENQNGDRVFDVSVVTSNPFLSIILTNLGVFLNENGFFTMVEDGKEQHHNVAPPVIQPPTPNISNLTNMLTQPPPNLIPNLPAGLDLNILNNLRPLLNQTPFNIRPNILSMPPPLVTNPLLNETLLRNSLFQNPNFPPQPLMSNMRPNDNFRNNDNRQNNQDNRRNNWNNNNNNNNRNNNNNNRHNNQRRRN